MTSLDPYLDSNFLLTIFVYTLQTTEIKEQQLRIILEDLPNKLNDKVMSTYDMILEKGIEKGLEKGIAQGRQEGRQEGKQEAIEQSILNAFDNNYKPAELAIIFGLTESKIVEILKANGRV